MRFVATSVVVLAVCLQSAFPADDAKITRENYDKIMVPMWKSEVEAILGKGDEEQVIQSNGGDFIIVTWRAKAMTITVRFRNNYYNGSKSIRKN